MTDELPDRIPAWQRRIAEAYARHPLVKRPRLREKFVRFASVRPGACVLDVLTGPGYNAFAFARQAASVTAVDSRPLLLAIARRELARRRLTKVVLGEADPEDLPFRDNTFDVVTCAAAVHHFRTPAAAFAEMARVCALGGHVAIEDVIASEQTVRARYYNRIERLQDRTHQRVLSLSEIVNGLGNAGLLVRKVLVLDSVREYNEWVAVTHPPARRSERIRRLLQGSVEHDLSGLRVQAEDDTFLFVQPVAWVLAVKPE